MSVSKNKTAAKTKLAQSGAQLSATQLDQAAGGVTVTEQTSSNTNTKSTTASRAADKTDAYIRS